MDDKPIKIELIYGMAYMRPEQYVTFVEPPPLKWYQIIYSGALELWWGVILPALMFAISFTAFKFAILGHF